MSTRTTHVDGSELEFFGVGLGLDLYYLMSDDEEPGQSHLGVLKECIQKWRLVIESTGENSAKAYLPVGIYDECIQCITATVDVGGVVEVQSVWLNEEGHTVSLDDLDDFISRVHSVVRGAKFGPKHVGDFHRSELVAALFEFEGRLTELETNPLSPGQLSRRSPRPNCTTGQNGFDIPGPNVNDTLASVFVDLDARECQELGLCQRALAAEQDMLRCIQRNHQETS